MSERAFRVLAAATVVIVGVWAGARVYLGFHGNSAAVVATPAGEASLPTPSDLGNEPTPGLIETKIPDRLPSFTLNDVQGRPTPVQRWNGRALVLNFWATWCAPCRHEIPMLKDLAGEWQGRGFTVMGIAVDHPDEVAKFARQLDMTYPILVGDQDALDLAKQLGVNTPVFPFTVFTDRKGEVVALYIGELHRSQASLILGIVQNIDRDELPIEQARRTIADGLKDLAGRPG